MPVKKQLKKQMKKMVSKKPVAKSKPSNLVNTGRIVNSKKPRPSPPKISTGLKRGSVPSTTKNKIMPIRTPKGNNVYRVKPLFV